MADRFICPLRQFNREVGRNSQAADQIEISLCIVFQGLLNLFLLKREILIPENNHRLQEFHIAQVRFFLHLLLENIEFLLSYFHVGFRCQGISLTVTARSHIRMYMIHGK